MGYQWLLALHILAMVAWMAAMLYLPRLFVYHAGVDPGSLASETFKIMERRLARAIMTPALIVTWLAGLGLVFWSGYYSAPWFMVKFVLVVALSGIHGWLLGRMREFANDTNRRPARTFRIVNEIPTVLLILIVILAVVKPF
jgi:putative membrane protein